MLAKTGRIFSLVSPHFTIYSSFLFFTREYTQCTAGYTFWFVVVVVVVVGGRWRPLIKLGTISADSWSNMIRHDQTWSAVIRHDQPWSDMISRDQTWSDLKSVQCEFFSVNSHYEFWWDMPGRHAGRLAWLSCPAVLPGSLARQSCPAVLLWQGSAVLLWQGSPAMTR
jgi:hypothetical protein